MIFCFERCMDKLGRIVIPMDLRRALKLTPGDTVMMVFEEDRLILKKKSK